MRTYRVECQSQTPLLLCNLSFQSQNTDSIVKDSRCTLGPIISVLEHYFYYYKLSQSSLFESRALTGKSILYFLCNCDCVAWILKELPAKGVAGEDEAEHQVIWEVLQHHHPKSPPPPPPPHSVAAWTPKGEDREGEREELWDRLKSMSRRFDTPPLDTLVIHHLGQQQHKNPGASEDSTPTPSQQLSHSEWVEDSNSCGHLVCSSPAHQMKWKKDALYNACHLNPSVQSCISSILQLWTWSFQRSETTNQNQLNNTIIYWAAQQQYLQLI